MSSVINDPRQWLNFVPDTLKASPLYTELWEHLRDDSEVLALAALVDTNQPIPITFFTAVNYLVLAEPQHPLALFYPYLHGVGAPPLSEAYPFFHDFVLAHYEELRKLLPTARLQTNEVTRCANLLPAFFLAWELGGLKPLNMIEVGSSAGFNLLWYLYHYSYGRASETSDILLGENPSPVRIHCELDGPHLPSLPETLPRVAVCQGIELVPRNIHHEEDMRWVRAAIWPEERARHQLLDTVIRFAQQTPFRLHSGDATHVLPALLAAIPEYQTGVIWHSYAINQGPFEVQERIEQQVADASYTRTLYRVSLEFVEKAGPRLELMTYKKGNMVKREHLANCAVHGERMTWRLPS